MPDENPTPRGFSVGDLASPETIGERVRAWAQPVSAEEAAANLRMFVDATGAAANFTGAVRKLQHHAGTTAEELQPLGDGIRAVAAQIAEEN